ncbi:hypothetical protein [Aminobacter phage Erebus]|nr:hypothetical protein [Aminobacter phage Erebus]
MTTFLDEPHYEIRISDKQRELIANFLTGAYGDLPRCELETEDAEELLVIIGMLEDLPKHPDNLDVVNDFTL